MKRNTWNTYKITGYTHQVGTDPRATGGVHLHQVRKATSSWQVRIVDSTGKFKSPGPVSPIGSDAGEALFQAARSQS
jgi:hypothetical protein